MEMFDIRKADGSLTGKTKERELVHQDGDIHGTAHVWIIRRKNEGGFDVLLQQRSCNKDAFPDCYDISSAGHIPAGDDFLQSALRELEEELGIKAREKDLHYVGMQYREISTEFYQKPFINNEISKIYVYDKGVNIKKLRLQAEEVSDVRWMDYSECRNRIKAGTLKHCILLEEFLMLGEAVKKMDENAKIGNNTSKMTQESQPKLTQESQSKVRQESQSKGVIKAKPKCSLNAQCGGCDFQGISYQEQLKKKQAQMEKLFKGHCPVRPIVGMDNPYNYRNKVHAVIGEDKDHQIISGTYQAGTHFIVPVETCMLEDEKADDIITTLRQLFKSFKFRAYNEDKHTGLIRHVLIKRGFRTNQIMVVIVTGSQVVPSKNNFVAALRKIHPDITTIVQNINDKSTSMVLGEKEMVWYGKGYIEDVLCGCTFRISSKSFYQINPVQTEKLYTTALEMAKLSKKETLIDTYCGIGTIGLIAASQVKEVIGVELNKDAVRDAIANAKCNNIRNCHFYQGDAGKFMVDMALDAGQKPVDVVIMDPPRSGSTEEFLTSVAKLSPKTIVYISCNPETQVRDMESLKKKGYKPVECRPFDMFPFTKHVETVVLLSQQKPNDRIKVDLDLDELDATSAETKATYAQIKDYVLEKHGLKVSSLYISQVKRKCGLEVGENYNLAKSEDAKQPNCPKEKEKAIIAALKFFGMI